ncbi:MAG TPA: type I 3-dehydroquinate dehydratase, partial [Eubacteriaceae bacterium]|nr:type I 3-dehydroquinate dehydratase [Eubacteriaceae bacterium]
ESLGDLPVDLIEWRGDFCSDQWGFEKGMARFKERGIRTPLLVTLRSKGEGGERFLDAKEYEGQLRHMLDFEGVDYVDIEFKTAGHGVDGLIERAGDRSVRTILSSHNFKETPSNHELKSLMQAMDRTEADLIKVALMPQKKSDVLRWMSFVEDMRGSVKKPIVAIAMGELGKITRYQAEYLESPITFASGKDASAPGQIPAAELKKLMTAIHAL